MSASERRRQLLAAVSVLGVSLGMGAATAASADAANPWGQTSVKDQTSLKIDQTTIKGQTSQKISPGQTSLKIDQSSDKQNSLKPATSLPPN
jgi:hypothetical protein